MVTKVRYTPAVEEAIMDLAMIPIDGLMETMLETANEEIRRLGAEKLTSSNLARMIENLFTKELLVTVPPKKDAKGNVIRKGYTRSIRPQDHVKSIATNETKNTFRNGRIRYYKARGDVPGMVWETDPASNTCADCESLDGKWFPMGYIPDRMHPECNCTMRPELKPGVFDPPKLTLNDYSFDRTLGTSPFPNADKLSKTGKIKKVRGVAR